MISDYFYLFLIILLFGLAISGLIVGVSNDAVNFLNSAVGAKVARFNMIIIVASAGVLVGATFSSGMMEVARKGILTPDMFVFDELMIIFLAVMVTNVLLLDTFNTFGMPTSTTVSLVFALLGGSVSVAVLKIVHSGHSISTLNEYINSSKALEIILGILFSVAVAFFFGAIIQWLSRLVFSFNYERRMPYFGSLFGGLALAVITYFLLVRGAKGSVLLSEAQSEWFLQHSLSILIASFLAWTVLFQLLYWITRFNVLKFVILAGTFALAMAFAGNDLVNFIGVPIAGYSAYEAYISQTDYSANEFYMSALSGPVRTNPLFLIAAGLIMVVTLYLNKKSRTVLETSVDLSRQDEGYERFGSSPLSRVIVRISRTMANSFDRIVPNAVKTFIDRQFQRPESSVSALESAPSFDLIRASVGLVISSILISIGTARKLPLSTTYVTFMVAMGASLADRAWGRETAVYRITGVLSVVGGWFLTAFIAFSFAFICALFLFYTGFVGILLLLALSVFALIRTQVIHRTREEKRKNAINARKANSNEATIALNASRNSTLGYTKDALEVLTGTLTGFIKEDRKALRKEIRRVQKLEEETQILRTSLYEQLRNIKEDEIEMSRYQVRAVEQLRELVYDLKFISEPCFEHVDNNHKPLRDKQEEEIELLVRDLAVIIRKTSEYIKDPRPSLIADFEQIIKLIEIKVEQLRMHQIRRVNMKEVGIRNTTLYMNLMQECSNCLTHALNIIHSCQELENLNNS